MLNRSASLAMSTSVLKALPGKLGIKIHSPSVLDIYIIAMIIIPTQCFYSFFGDFDCSVGKVKWFLHFNKNLCV